MKEIEILVEVYESENEALEKLKKYEFIGIKKTIDIYYYDPLRENLKPNENNQLNECFRLRKKAEEYFICYKIDKFDENKKWLYSDEYETNIGSFEEASNIIKRLGLKELLRIENEKHTYVFGDYEIVLEKVKDLGLFLEVEFCCENDCDISKIKFELQEIINNLNIKVSEELNMGKPEMILGKNI